MTSNSNPNKNTSDQPQKDSQYEPRTDLPNLDAYPLIQTLQGHKGGIPTVRFKPDGTRVVSASTDHTAKIWDLETGTAILTLKEHTQGVSDVCYTSDGKLIATACDDRIVRIWDDRSGECVRQLVGHTHYVSSCCFSVAGNVLASTSFDETIRLWDVQHGREIGVIPSHSDAVVSVDFCSDQAKPILSTASTDGVCRIWSMGTRECLRSILPNPEQPIPIGTSKFTPNNKFILLSMLNNKLELWDWDAAFTAEETRSMSPPYNTNEYEKPNIQMRKEYIGHKNTKYAIHSAFLVNDPKGKFVLSGSEDHHVYVWNLNNKNIVGLLRGRATAKDTGNGHCDVVLGVDTNPVEPMIATSGASRDCTVKIWKPKGAW